MVETYFIAAGIIIIALFFVRIIAVSHTLVFIYLGFLGGLCFQELAVINFEVTGLLHADALGVLFLFITLIISAFCTLHYIIYARKRNQIARTIAIHNGSFVIFVTAISGVFLSTHIGLLWAFLEA